MKHVCRFQSFFLGFLEALGRVLALAGAFSQGPCLVKAEPGHVATASGSFHAHPAELLCPGAGWWSKEGAGVWGAVQALGLGGSGTCTAAVLGCWPSLCAMPGLAQCLKSGPILARLPGLLPQEPPP